ncbi:uncharacterized protein LOC135962523 [Calliphora vicina]|uniref:uncharacterized protein LOC135962523 n=1 Tax=Calliphora vicina TaxID=7373 RepID=UPI00325BEBB3
MYKCISFILSFLCCLSWGFQTFEDNIKFCINKETTHLSEEQNTDCDILATPLTTNEKQMFQNTICKDYGVPIDTFYYFKLRNGNLVGRGEDHEICNITDSLLLAWIPYEQFKRYYGQKLNLTERLKYIAKAIDEKDKTELCYLLHIDLIYNNTEQQFACVLMIYEDNFFGLKNNINVLVEIENLRNNRKCDL